MPKAGYYAVQRGRTTGIFDTWNDCEDQVKGFVGAKYKKFSNRADAEAFVAGVASIANTSSSVPSTSTTHDMPSTSSALPDTDEPGTLVVYTDGACKGNGKSGSVAGIGVWWGHNDPRNIAERCPGDQTNNRAELIAILRMLEETPISSKPLLVKSDSQYSINCLTNWIFKWQSNGFRGADGNPVKNAGVIRCIWTLLGIREASGQKVKFEYVKGHSGHVGNDGADDMANRGATLPEAEERDWAKEDSQLQQKLKELQQNKRRLPFPVQSTATIIPTSTPLVPVPIVPKFNAPPDTPVRNSNISTPAANKVTASIPLLPESPLKVLYVGPPLVPVEPSDVNFDDYADCLLDDDALAGELSD